MTSSSNAGLRSQSPLRLIMSVALLQGLKTGLGCTVSIIVPRRLRSGYGTFRGLRANSCSLKLQTMTPPRCARVIESGVELPATTLLAGIGLSV